MLFRSVKSHIKPVASKPKMPHNRSVPLNNPNETVSHGFNCGPHGGCGVLNRDGMFYAQLQMGGDGAPVLIALHGVSSEGQAQQALETLTQNAAHWCQSPLQVQA